MKNKAITPNPSDPADISVTLSCQQYQRLLITLTWTPDLCPQLMEIFDQGYKFVLNCLISEIKLKWQKKTPKAQTNNKDNHLEVSEVALNTMLCMCVKYNLSSVSRHSKGIKIFVFAYEQSIPWKIQIPFNV